MQTAMIRIASVSMLFFVAFGIRLFGITDTPLDFHPTKQYRSAITTRAFYFQDNLNIPAWRREVADDSLRRIGIIVPTPQEVVIARLYQLAGEEQVWYGRLLSALCWVCGGAFLFLLSRRLASFEASLIATGFYLFAPFGVIASQSFQPDAPMVGALALSLLLIVRYHEHPGIARLTAAAASAALAVFLKPIAAFFVIPAFIGGAIGLSHERGRLRLFETCVFLAAVAAPSLAFYLHRILIAGFTEWQRETSFFPSFLLEFRFWDGWLKRIRLAMGFTYFFGGLVGTLLARERMSRSLLIALWIGYFMMCFFTSYKISTHDYYHLPLILIVTLSLTQIIDALLARLDRDPVALPWRAAMSFTVVVGLLLAAGTSIQARRRAPDYAPQVTLAERIGSIVEHSTATIFLAPYYGRPLMYHGELSGESWPYRHDIRDESLYRGTIPSTEERFGQMVQNNAAKYFIVLDRDELEFQPELADLLKTYHVVSQDEDHAVFDLRIR